MAEAFAWWPVHDWRERLPLGSGYVCLECRRTVATAMDMDTAPDCHQRRVPLSWLPQKEQARHG